MAGRWARLRAAWAGWIYRRRHPVPGIVVTGMGPFPLPGERARLERALRDAKRWG